MGYWIVVVDDEPLSLTNAKNLLRSQNMKVSCLKSGSDLLEFIGTHSPDLILLDILMPEMDGFETYRALRQYEESRGLPQVPVIFLTGEDDNEAERRGLKAGASDFIHKPFDEGILVKRINNTIENKKTIESLKEEATIDKLTGFLNKATGTEKISEQLKKSSGTLLIMDLDNFKLVNDLYGHDMGDRILMAFAGIVSHNVRSDDLVSRIGGDEFMAFFSDMTEKDSVFSLSERLNSQLAGETASLLGEDHGIPFGISIGAAIASGSLNDYQILFQYADSALYEIKRNGKHGCRIYDPDNAGAFSEEDLDFELARAVNIVSERGDVSGAMLLGQEAFSWNYRFIERFMTRYGGTTSRILFSLSSDENGIIFSEMVSEFGNTLKKTLRKTDIILQWKQNQFFVALPFLMEEDIQRVINRLLSVWDKSGYHDRLNISYATSQSIEKESYPVKAGGIPGRHD